MVLDRRSVMAQEAEGDLALVLYLRLFVQIGQPVLQIPTLGCHYKFHLNDGIRATGSNYEAFPGIFFRLLILRQQARQSFLPG